MRLFNLIKKFSLISIAIFMIACGNDDESSEIQIEESPEKQINVLATTPMLGEYVKQVAGDNINVDILMPYSADPHHFEPSPQYVTKIESADLVFYVGLKYETAPLLKLLENSSNSKQALIEIGEKINPIEFEEDGHDEHEGHDDHDHELGNPHFWFDPIRVVAAVDAIVASLARVDPESADLFEKNANDYKNLLNKLDEEIASQINTIPESNRTVMTEHQSLLYFTEKYGLESVESVIPQTRNEVGPTPRDLERAIEAVKHHNLKVIFVEFETNKAAAERVAEESGIKLSDELQVETLKDNQSYEDFMRQNVSIIVSGLSD